ncbi:hypothetical protein BOTCAL_0534g00060 [Botryotinia calthae]|uniref:Uncharacterized protein n=1 Tax=Botryotinia calthae TaxID=38488 RepID=A0A4Y8CL78_9HELO|nr:hypothetical protein BOTCAL_0534g00060 [Botryotinia calthae]
MEDDFFKNIDLNLNININLPKDAPQGHPHLLNVKRPQHNPHPPPTKSKKRKSRRIEFPDDLSLVDVLATIIFDWKPAALHHLLNVEDEQFYYAAEWEQGTVEYDVWDRFMYVHRFGQYVRIAIVGIVTGAEVSYRICNNKKWEIVSAQNYDTEDNYKYWVPSDPINRCACKKIEKRMAQLIFQQFLVNVVLQNMIFPVLIYEPEPKSKKGKKSRGCTTTKLKDVGRESNTGSSSDTLMEGNINARVAELEARKRRRENYLDSVQDINLEQEQCLRCAMEP